MRERLQSKREQVQISYQQETLYCADGAALEQAAQKSCGCLLSGSVKSASISPCASCSSGRCTCLWQRSWNQGIFKIHSEPNHSVVLELSFLVDNYPPFPLIKKPKNSCTKITAAQDMTAALHNHCACYHSMVNASGL